VLSEALCVRVARGIGVVLYQTCRRAAIAGDYEVQMCGLTGMTVGRGISGAPKAAREACHPGSTASPGFTNIRANGGDRYGSAILPGEPPEWAEVYEFMAIECPVKRGDGRRRSGG
jgi:hypothetical protein